MHSLYLHDNVSYCAWRKERYSDFFSEFDKIKGLTLYFLVKIAKDHQKGHQKLNMKSFIDGWCEIAIVYLELNQIRSCQFLVETCFRETYAR